MTVIIHAWFGELGKEIMEIGSRYYEERYSERIRLYDGIPELLSALYRDGYRLGIVSSNRRKFVVRGLRDRGLDALFHAIVCQEDTDRHKPYPDPLWLAAERMSLSPKQCVYIGDQPSDIQAARSAGMMSAAALWGDGRIEKLSQEAPDMIFHSPKYVFDALSSLCDRPIIRE